MHLFLKTQAPKKPPWPSHSCFILTSATTDGFLVRSKFANNFSGSSSKTESFLSLSLKLCVCSELFSEIFWFLLCSRFMTYVLPSLLVIILNSSSSVSTCSIALRKEATTSTSLQSFSPDAVHGSQNKAKTQPTSLLSKHTLHNRTRNNIKLTAEQTKQVLSVTASIAICANKLQALEEVHYLQL